MILSFSEKYKIAHVTFSSRNISEVITDLKERVSKNNCS